MVCDTRDDARAAVRAMLGERQFGNAGDVVIIESFLTGEELSVLAVTNGRDVCIFPTAQDHKRLMEGDVGPNTGGTGAYAPAALATREVLARVEREVLRPALAELERRGASFRGVLYAGLMLHSDGTPNVVEFNCRLGDPETEVVLPLVAVGRRHRHRSDLCRGSGRQSGRSRTHSLRWQAVSARYRVAGTRSARRSMIDDRSACSYA